MPELGIQSVPNPTVGSPSRMAPCPEAGAFGRQSAPRVSFRDPLVSEGGPRRTLSAPPSQRRRPRSPPPGVPSRHHRHRGCHCPHRHRSHCPHSSTLRLESDSGSCSSSESSEDDGFFLGERIPLPPHLTKPFFAQGTTSKIPNSMSPQLPQELCPEIPHQAREKNCILA